MAVTANDWHIYWFRYVRHRRVNTNQTLSFKALIKLHGTCHLKLYSINSRGIQTLKMSVLLT